MDLEELVSLCKDNDIEIPKDIEKKKGAAKKKALAEYLIETYVDTEEVVDEFAPSEERTEAEDAIEEDIRGKFEKGKLKIAAIKKELTKVYEGEAECKGCKKCSEDEILDCYISWKRSFVNDDGEEVDAETEYTRNGTRFCCGKELVDGDDGPMCEICGAEYTEE